jgi:hypothetical protein
MAPYNGSYPHPDIRTDIKSPHPTMTVQQDMPTAIQTGRTDCSPLPGFPGNERRPACLLSGFEAHSRQKSLNRFGRVDRRARDRAMTRTLGQPSSARRPRYVTLIAQALTSCRIVMSPARAKRASIRLVKPWASMSASAVPCWLTRSSSARRASPLRRRFRGAAATHPPYRPILTSRPKQDLGPPWRVIKGTEVACGSRTARRTAHAGGTTQEPSGIP